MVYGGVSLPLMHRHLMMPWNDMGKGRCCGRFDSITDGYYCESCDYFFHKKCSESSEYIQHPSHSDHTLELRSDPHHSCNLCGDIILRHFYRCEICDFDMHLYCAMYPPPKVIDDSETHQHKLTLLEEKIKFECAAKCGKMGYEFPYECKECDLAFHTKCVWHPTEVKHPLEYTTIDSREGVSLPWIHKHFMMPWNDMRKGDCCGRSESISDGYFCKKCDFFIHKKCGEEAPESIKHPFDSVHPLWLRSAPNQKCNLCFRSIVDLCYRCEICDFNMDIHCAMYTPPKVHDIPEMHCHMLTLLKKLMWGECDAKCGKTVDYQFSYRCHQCDLTFHVDCVWHHSEIKHPLEVNHPHHSLHPLTLVMGQLPDKSDGRCCLCGSEIDDRLFYHCSSCNFTLDMRCVLHPPPQTLLDLKAHDHQLSLLPKLISFTCNACGLSGDRSPYKCVQCEFVIHKDCLGLPRLININRHDHRICRTSLLGVENSVCGVCHKKMDWTCGGYSCKRCPGYVVHSKCATRDDVWNGNELEGVPEEIEDIEPYVVIDNNTIHHFSHKEHYLRLDANGALYEEKKQCSACTHPIGLQSFYGCIDCDFVLHQNCAELPKRKWHVLHNDRLTLVTSTTKYFKCSACVNVSNGFMYQHGNMELDVRCSSISEPFVHPGHPDHPLYYNPRMYCNGCGMESLDTLTCIEDGCKFGLCFQCATLPQEVKHRVDDHPLLLCFGGEEASGKYWCDICETVTNPKTWFYTSKDHQASLHTECVVGEFGGLMPRSSIEYAEKSYEVVLNNSMTRPSCTSCKSRCLSHIILKISETSDAYICSFNCARWFAIDSMSYP